MEELFLRGCLSPRTLRDRIEHMSIISSEEHFPSSPFRNPTHVLYFRNFDMRVKAVHCFCTSKAARAFVDLTIGHMDGQSIKWISSTKLSVGDGLVVESDKLEAIMEEERPIKLPYPYPSFAAAIAGKGNPGFQLDELTGTPSPRKATRSAEAAPQRRTRTKADGDLVSAGDLAEELGLNPSRVRSTLRDNGIGKPYQWAPGPELDRIRGMLKK